MRPMSAGTTNTGGYVTQISTNRLMEIIENLTDEDRRAVVAFAEYLQSRNPMRPETERVWQEPVVPVRAPDETVVGAIKRLAAAYPMLDRKALLGDVSDMMSQYLVHGRSVTAVIDDLEALYQRRYREARGERPDHD
jgi:hypothetical protein